MTLGIQRFFLRVCIISYSKMKNFYKSIEKQKDNLIKMVERLKTGKLQEHIHMASKHEKLNFIRHQENTN